MKRTLSLLGLFFLGVGLLFNPVTGLLGTTAPELSAGSSPTSVVTTGEPPPPDPETITPDSSPTARGAETPAPTTTTTETPEITTIEVGSPTVVGPAVETTWGPFQVEVVVEDGVLVAVNTLQQPGDRRSRRINEQAIPWYEELAVEAQSADIDVISGATVTWQGYTTSLQAALDEVGLG